jgi:dTDP-4-dehydrorhamnose reductase
MELPIFTRTDCAYIKEYCKVIAPIAKSFDLLQGEANAYFATLLPTICGARQQLQQMIDTRGELLYCKDLAKALLAGLKTRFQHLENDEKCQLAAAFHPIFCNLGWLATEKHEDLKKKMQDLIAADLKKRV